MKTTKKIMTLLLALLLPVTAFALPPTNYNLYEFEVDGIYYKIEGDVACVSCQRYESGMHLSDYHGDVVIPSTVTYQGTTYPVTIIDYYAFNYCQGLTSITIPVSITTIRNSAFYDCTGLTSVIIKDIAAWCRCDIMGSDSNPLYYAQHLYLNDTEVTELTIPEGITAIRKYAFLGWTGLTSVTIPNSVTSIGDNAFDGCTGLMSISIPNSVTEIGQVAFEGCTSMMSVTLGNSVASIGMDAFQNAPAIETVTCMATTPPTWENMSMFTTNVYNHTPLHVPVDCERDYKANPNWGQFVNIKGDISEVMAYDFEVDGIYYKIDNNEAYVTFKSYVYELHDVHCESDYTGDVIIPATVTYQGKAYPVTSIGEQAFRSCGGMTSVTLPNTITSIGHHAFFYCKGLSSIEIPNSVSSIGYDAFELCEGLTEVRITDIAAWCNINFEDYYANPLCYAHHLYLNDIEVTDLIIPESVTTIGGYTFLTCAGLTSLEVPESVTSIGNAAFRSCTELTRVRIGNSVTHIDSWAFAGCSALTSLTLGSTIATIDEAAFQECTSLTNIRIPDSVTTIGTSAFNGCSSLTTVRIGNSVTDIGSRAFDYCPTLLSVTIGKSVRNIGKDAFKNDPAIETIICKAMTPPWWADMSMFATEVYSHAQVHVLAISEAFYKADHYWGQFQNIIGDLSENDLNGDVNGDGEINIADANSVIDIVVMGGNNGHSRAPAADVNDDGEINIADVNAIINIIHNGQ